ncbi:MAG: ROK family protein [Solirubrobacterales bacterium]|nr:ROK family protein [Solirubrobacterales bacterium]
MASTGSRALRGGIDLGGTKIEAVVVDGRNNVVGSARRPTPTAGGPQDIADELVASITEACTAADVTTAKLRGVGVGSPGIVDDKTGSVSNALNLPGWNGSFGLAKALRDVLRTSVRIGNDVQVATDGEFALGAGKPYKSLLGVFWGTGVGGGLVLDGKPWIGRGGAGEIGHMVVKIGGARCPCGRRGCMEAYAGRRAMEARARKLHERGTKTDLFKLMEKRGRTRLTSGVWARALKHDDKLAHEIIDRAIGALGAGIASAVNLLDVEAVVIGGGLGVRFGEPMVRRIEEAMQPHLFNDQRPPDVHVAALGDQGGAIGASLLVQRPPAGSRRPRSARRAPPRARTRRAS